LRRSMVSSRTMEFCCVGVPWRGLRPALPRWRVPREVNTPHDLHDIPVIGFCTMLCGGEDCSDMAVFGRAKAAFLRQFLRLRHGVPSHDTFSRVFRLLDPAQFHGCFLRFMQDAMGVAGRDRD
jgi:hypothetical protein